MKTLIIIFSCLLLVMPAQAAKSEEYNQKLEEIEKYIARRRVEIENFYADQLSEVKYNSEAEIRLLEIAGKPVFTSLAAQAKVAKWVLHINDYGYTARWDLVAKTERMLHLKDDFDEHKSYDDFEDSIKRSPKRFVVAQSQVAERKSRILAQLEHETTKLERQKNYALTVALPALEERMKQELLQPKPKPTHGVVTGILYSADNPLAIIDGQIVHEGDVIYGVTVVKIDRDRITFSKKGTSWEQKVQESPKSYLK